MSTLFQHNRLLTARCAGRLQSTFIAAIDVWRADVPCGSKPVSLSLEVRKFFCRSPTCPRQIFTERLPDLVEPWARLTNRLRSALQALGLATGGAGGAGLAPKLGMRVAPTTVLRSLREASTSSVTQVRVLGLDDWAYKRGNTYGTIMPRFGAAPGHRSAA